jgi:hypothetical protein
MAHSKFKLEHDDILAYVEVDWKQQWRISFGILRAILLLATQVNELNKIVKRSTK